MACADPGIQYDTTINEWHTCPADGRINASNPCSEYMFLDDTACNLASINLIKFYDPAPASSMSRATSTRSGSGPSCSRSACSWRSSRAGDRAAQLRLPHARPRLRQPRRAAHADGDPLRQRKSRGAIAGALTASWAVKATPPARRWPAEQGAFPKYERNKREHAARDPQPPPRRLQQHAASSTRGSASCPSASIATSAPPRCSRQPARPGTKALELGEKHGFRNAQVTVLAPTGTIGLIMDCDTTGIEPDFALVKFKKLAGGGYFKIINQSIPPALRKLGYNEGADRGHHRLLRRHKSLIGAPAHQPRCPQSQRASPRSAREVEAALENAFEIGFAFNKYTLGEDFCKNVLGFTTSSSTTGPSTCSPRWASPKRRSTPRTSTSAAR